MQALRNLRSLSLSLGRARRSLPLSLSLSPPRVGVVALFFVAEDRSTVSERSSWAWSRCSWIPDRSSYLATFLQFFLLIFWQAFDFNSIQFNSASLSSFVRSFFLSSRAAFVVSANSFPPLFPGDFDLLKVHIQLDLMAFFSSWISVLENGWFDSLLSSWSSSWCRGCRELRTVVVVVTVAQFSWRRSGFLQVRELLLLLLHCCFCCVVHVGLLFLWFHELFWFLHLDSFVI